MSPHIESVQRLDQSSRGLSLIITVGFVSRKLYIHGCIPSEIQFIQPTVTCAVRGDTVLLPFLMVLIVVFHRMLLLYWACIIHNTNELHIL